MSRLKRHLQRYIAAAICIDFTTQNEQQSNENVQNGSATAEAYDCNEVTYVKLHDASQAGVDIIREEVLSYQGEREYTEWNKFMVEFHGAIYNATCKVVRVETLPDDGTCYERNAKKVKYQGRTMFRTNRWMIIPTAAQIECYQGTGGQKLGNKILRKLRREHSLANVDEALSGNPTIDFTIIFNAAAAYSILVLTESCLCGGGFLVKAKIFYRKYFSGMLLLASLLYAAYCFALTLFARYVLGARWATSLRLSVPSFKRTFETWMMHKKLRKRAAAMLLKRERMERFLDPNLTLEELAFDHLKNLYEQHMEMQRKIKQIEKKSMKLSGKKQKARIREMKSTLAWAKQAIRHLPDNERKEDEFQMYNLPSHKGKENLQRKQNDKKKERIGSKDYIAMTSKVQGVTEAPTPTQVKTSAFEIKAGETLMRPKKPPRQILLRE